MSFRIAIRCCNYLYGEGIKQLIEQDGLDIDTAINCFDPRKLRDGKLTTDTNE
ncbi:MAG: hypothetical protein V3U54_13600 [Thermodesulfobacteriota bacterium]